MTPQDEAIALRWIEQRLRVHNCPRCGGTWVTAATVAAVYHRCPNGVPARTPTGYLDELEHERRSAWARRILGSQLTASFSPVRAGLPVLEGGNCERR